MKLEKLISALKCNGDYAILHDGDEIYLTADDGRLMLKAAEAIRLLWEVAQDNTNSKYKMQIDEWVADNG